MARHEQPIVSRQMRAMLFEGCDEPVDAFAVA